MIKILPQIDALGQPSKIYDLFCYVYSEISHTNVELYSIRNLTEDGLERFLKGRGVDTDFGFVVLKSNRPCIFTDAGEILPIPADPPLVTQAKKGKYVKSRVSNA